MAATEAAAGEPWAAAAAAATAACSLQARTPLNDGTAGEGVAASAGGGGGGCATAATDAVTTFRLAAAGGVRRGGVPAAPIGPPPRRSGVATAVPRSAVDAAVAAVALVAPWPAVDAAVAIVVAAGAAAAPRPAIDAAVAAAAGDAPRPAADAAGGHAADSTDAMDSCAMDGTRPAGTADADGRRVARAAASTAAPPAALAPPLSLPPPTLPLRPPPPPPWRARQEQAVGAAASPPQHPPSATASSSDDPPSHPSSYGMSSVTSLQRSTRRGRGRAPPPLGRRADRTAVAIPPASDVVRRGRTERGGRCSVERRGAGRAFGGEEGNGGYEATIHEGAGEKKRKGGPRRGRGAATTDGWGGDGREARRRRPRLPA